MTARREDIEAAVSTYDDANQLASLPRKCRRLLIAMFAASDVCQCSLDDIAASGFSRRTLPMTLWRLTRAGFLSWQRGSPSTYRLHLPPLVRR
jgi:hypothetical protein